MRTSIKKIILLMPKGMRVLMLKCYESAYYWNTILMTRGERRVAGIPNKNKLIQTEHSKPSILFYHISGLSFGGTEKFLQIIAKHINKSKYDVHFMYSPKPRPTTGPIRLDGRLPYLKDSGIDLIEFDYESLEPKYPHILKGARPSIFQKINETGADLIFVTGTGYTEYPFNVIEDIPIILLNNFGSFNTQKNIVANICVSPTVEKKAALFMDSSKLETIYVQSERPDPAFKQLGLGLRAKFGIKDTDVVFGRIGRADDGIFDPIGIRAFKKVVQEHPEAHYIIMSPPPIVKEIVKNENILNVHYCTPSAVEADVWAFHYSLDALAHFRLDGESFGLNIAESMIAGNPIITHRSHIWNAHLEYLDPSFSFIADKDDVEAYAKHMKSIIAAKKDGSILNMKKAAEETGSKLFLIENSIGRIEQIIEESLATSNK